MIAAERPAGGRRPTTKKGLDIFTRLLVALRNPLIGIGRLANPTVCLVFTIAAREPNSADEWPDGAVGPEATVSTTPVEV